jgi:hypothetical protein
MFILFECYHQVVPACSGYFHLEHSRSCCPLFMQTAVESSVIDP